MTGAERDCLSRDFAVAVFVVHERRVLLRWHPRLGRWLPPGGHIEPDEVPDDAAMREVWEETGVAIRLIGASGIDVDLPGQPRQLCRPLGIQLADISPGHQHVDLVYLAEGEPGPSRDGVGWFTEADLAALQLGDEVAAWCRVAIASDAGGKEAEMNCASGMSRSPTTSSG